MAESALPPAMPLLDHHQVRFVLRLMARPKGRRVPGQEEILERMSGLTARIKERCGLKRRDTVEVQVWEEFRPFLGRAFVESKEDAMRTAMEWQDREGTIRTDGPRLGSG